MSRLRRHLGLTALAGLLVLGAAACEVGEKVDLGSGGGTSGVAIVVRQTSTGQPTKGQPLNLEATVTEDGTPLTATAVTWSVSPTDPTLTFNPGNGSTNSQGIHNTTLNSTSNSPGSITVTATAAGATGSQSFILQ